MATDRLDTPVQVFWRKGHSLQLTTQAGPIPQPSS